MSQNILSNMNKLKNMFNTVVIEERLIKIAM